jgi:GalNAc-alpha-(1->4)-GalNAc-alpha-(1->3)-diNAcBac-PP-undecaprenol alpha-1,4-N-acetyl-D-galactosaminyltransferase
MKTKFERKKFLFVIDNLTTGGAQRQMIILALGLMKRGYQVEIFCYAHGDLLAQPLYDAGIPIHWHFKRSRYSPNVIIDLRNLINRGRFNLVLSFLSTPNFYAILAGRLLSIHRVPVIVSERFCDLPQGVSKTERFSRQFYRLATHVVVNSHHQRINLTNKYPWISKRISTIYNGYDLNYFIPAATEPDNHPLKIISIASVSPYKNGMCLVEALNLLHLRDDLKPQVDWVGQLVMKGDRLEYLNKMKQAITDYGLDEQWQWMNQRLDIVNQLHQHDVLVHPSYGEGLPNVVCEALACARPVIVSDIFDHSQLVKHGESGYLFDYRNPSDLAEKIKIFMGLSPDERMQMGRCGRQYAEVNLSQEKLVNEYEHLFLNVL